MANPEANRTPALVATVVVLWVLSLAAIAARFIARRIGGTKLGWDDWLILNAAVRILRFGVPTESRLLMLVSR